MTMHDNSQILATGEVHDTIRFVEDGEFLMPDGSLVKGRAGEEVKLPVVHNMILYTFPKLVAALIKGDASFFGKMYWEVGEGESTWKDNNLPTPTLADVGLKKPTFRKAVEAENIKYLNPSTNEVTTEITNKIQVECVFTPSEANGYLREFSIFLGGDLSLGTGLPINRKIHGVIYKTTGIELQRKIHFQFNV